MGHTHSYAQDFSAWGPYTYGYIIFLCGAGDHTISLVPQTLFLYQYFPKWMISTWGLLEQLSKGMGAIVTSGAVWEHILIFGGLVLVCFWCKGSIFPG